MSEPSPPGPAAFSRSSLREESFVQHTRKACPAAPRTRSAATALLAATAVLLAGCERGSSGDPAESASGPSGCPAVHAEARAAVSRAERTDIPWNGPTTGPRAVTGETIVYVAQTMTNPGVAGAAAGVREAARVIGWNVRVIDGGGTPAGIQAAMSEAVALRPSGIVIGGFDPNTTSQQLARADAAGIPLIGWHAVAAPGPSRRPALFTNVTTQVEDVARISAQWVISTSQGNAGVVVLTDASIPFAKHKSDLIREELATCSGVNLLSYENIPIPDASSRTPRVVSSLLSRFQDRWTHSVAINDLYFADAAPALRAAGKDGSGPPFNIGAGDGDPSAFQRINNEQYQAATVPEPLSLQGWQIVDEFNRAFSGRPASGYVAPVHISTADNSDGATSWDPSGYRDGYRKIWGR
ncbi:substrate-binding domain-containing protein [Streptomyces sp. TG1A-60]|uniref:substrate-binding domain-containing protein n=1 Tax=Streptomyces sp. TG1A-60 TaxID=3129111 RepID=UPI0030D117DA